MVQACQTGVLEPLGGRGPGTLNRIQMQRLMSMYMKWPPAHLIYSLNLQQPNKYGRWYKYMVELQEMP